MHLPNTQRPLGEEWCLVLLQQASLIFSLSPESLKKKRLAKMEVLLLAGTFYRESIVTEQKYVLYEILVFLLW